MRIKVLIIVFIFAMVFVGIYLTRDFPGKTMRLRVGIIDSAKSANIIIAKQRGFFEEVGLDVVIDVKKQVQDNLRSIFQQKIDLTNVSNIEVVKGSLRKNKRLTILGVTNANNAFAVVGRSDRGITSLKRIKNRTVALDKLGMASLWLDNSLRQVGNLLPKLKVYDLKPEQGVAALVRGDVDMIVSRFPYVKNAYVALGEKGVFIEGENITSMNWNLVCLEDWWKKKEIEIVRFMQAIDRANEFIKKNKQISQEIVARYLGISKYLIDVEWNRHQFVLKMPQSIFFQLEQTTRWYFKQKKMEREMPDFGDFMAISPIRSVFPSRVTVVER